jgi:hypothetical protein
MIHIGFLILNNTILRLEHTKPNQYDKLFDPRFWQLLCILQP